METKPADHPVKNRKEFDTTVGYSEDGQRVLTSVKEAGGYLPDIQVASS